MSLQEKIAQLKKEIAEREAKLEACKPFRLLESAQERELNEWIWHNLSKSKYKQGDVVLPNGEAFNATLFLSDAKALNKFGLLATLQEAEKREIIALKVQLRQCELERIRLQKPQPTLQELKDITPPRRSKASA